MENPVCKRALACKRADEKNRKGAWPPARRVAVAGIVGGLLGLEPVVNLLVHAVPDEDPVGHD